MRVPPRAGAERCRAKAGQAYSIGASLSPILAYEVMTLLKTPFGLFAFWGIINAALARIMPCLRKREKNRNRTGGGTGRLRTDEIPPPVATALDPRTEPDTDTA